MLLSKETPLIPDKAAGRFPLVATLQAVAPETSNSVLNSVLDRSLPPVTR